MYLGPQSVSVARGGVVWLELAMGAFFFFSFLVLREKQGWGRPWGGSSTSGRAWKLRGLGSSMVSVGPSPSPLRGHRVLCELSEVL